MLYTLTPQLRNMPEFCRNLCYEQASKLGSKENAELLKLVYSLRASIFYDLYTQGKSTLTKNTCESIMRLTEPNVRKVLV
jgi:hypothetical protein